MCNLLLVTCVFCIYMSRFEVVPIAISLSLSHISFRKEAESAHLQMRRLNEQTIYMVLAAERNHQETTGLPEMTVAGRCLQPKS